MHLATKFDWIVNTSRQNKIANSNQLLQSFLKTTSSKKSSQQAQIAKRIEDSWRFHHVIARAKHQQKRAGRYNYYTSRI